MRIKRRLFLSNILMIIIPVLLSLVVTIVVMFAVRIEVDDDRGFVDAIRFRRAATQMQFLTNKWSEGSELEQIKLDIDTFAEEYGSDSIMLSIYRGLEPLYTSGRFPDSPIMEAALQQKGSHNIIIDDSSIHTENVGEYTVALVDTNYLHKGGLDTDQDHQYLRLTGLLLFLLVIAIVLVTNRFLTSVVFKSIITPLDILVYGVHQIRDGNLGYRINYKGEDEFLEVCADFNEMGRRLLDMVNARQKDDENRRELIAGISHDLRTPLTSIKAYVEGLEKGIATTPHLRKRYLDTIKNKTEDLEYIINQLFLFSKLDIGEFPFRMEMLDIGEELAEFVDSVSDEYKQKGMQIALMENVRDVIVNVDSVQLKNVFANILENSFKYGNKEETVINIACRTEGTDAVVITLTDNGPGVPEEALEKLFNVFYRGDKARSNTGQGSGLGLAIAAKIIKRLGGTICAENAPEGGLAIIITLVKGGSDNFEENIDY